MMFTCSRKDYLLLSLIGDDIIIVVITS